MQKEHWCWVPGFLQWNELHVVPFLCLLSRSPSPQPCQAQPRTPRGWGGPGRLPGLDCGDPMETCCLSALRGPHARWGPGLQREEKGPGGRREGLHPLTPRLGRQPFPGPQTGLSACEAQYPAVSGIMTLTCPSGLPKGVRGCSPHPPLAHLGSQDSGMVGKQAWSLSGALPVTSCEPLGRMTCVSRSRISTSMIGVISTFSSQNYES